LQGCEYLKKKIMNEIHFVWPTYQNAVVEVYSCKHSFPNWNLIHNLIYISPIRALAGTLLKMTGTDQDTLDKVMDSE